MTKRFSLGIAAEAAGLGKVTLLEEPQAAFYAWIAEADREWRALIGPGDIDLGTTNCAIALTDLEADQTEVLEVTQILGPNRIGERRTLPSALYIPHHAEFPENSFPLPWEDETGDARIIGHFAREHGALVP